MRRIFFSAVLAIVACAAVFAIYPSAARAAGDDDPQFLITWESSNYAPAWYEGKKFPVEFSSVRVSFEMVGRTDKDRGKLIDLSGSEVRWYVKGDLVQRSTGGQSMIVNNRDFAGNSIQVKIAAQYANPVSGGKYFVEKWVYIPIKRPEIVIRSIAPTAALEKPSYEALPFFFNAPDYSLDVKWTINGFERTGGGAGSPFAYAVQDGDMANGGLGLQCVIANGRMERASKSYYIAAGKAD